MLQRFLLPTSLLFLAAACSVLIDVDAPQCKVDADCAKLSGAPADAVCVQSVCVAPSDEAPTAGAGGESTGDPLVCEKVTPSKEDTVKYTFAPTFAETPKEPKPFSVRACGQLDLTCDSPLFGPIDVNALEPQDFIVPTGFNGYFLIQNPDTLDGLLFMGRPVVVDTVGWAVIMPTPQVVAQLALATQKDVDPELGLIISVARDCNQQPVQGVTFTSSEQEKSLGYYFINSLPNTSIMQTGPQGAVGYANVPIGTAILSGTTESGKMLGPVSVRVKPHTLSFGEIFP
jgi:hypothetical protein